MRVYQLLLFSAVVKHCSAVWDCNKSQASALEATIVGGATYI